VTLGLDVGGTKVAGGLVAADGRVVRQLMASSQVGGRRDPGLAVTRRMAEELAGAASRGGFEVDGIGAGFPEFVDAQGRLTSRLVLDWDTQPGPLLADLAPVTLESDVRCGAIGEAVYGRGRSLPSFVYVSAGTGISSCLVQNGRPVRGARGEAISLGELPVAPDVDPDAGGTLEQYASGDGIRSRFTARAGQPVSGAREVLAAADLGDAAAIEIVSTAARALAAALSWLVHVLDPAAVILGGGLGHAAGLWAEVLHSETGHRLAVRPSAPPLLRGDLGPAAGIIGAAAAHRQAAGSSGVSPSAGRAGQAGQDGRPGQAGQDGRAGQADQDGRAGQAGQDGRAGQAGQDGRAGQAGQDGRAGQARRDRPPPAVWS
jgi:glucokinase